MNNRISWPLLRTDYVAVLCTVIIVVCLVTAVVCLVTARWPGVVIAALLTAAFCALTLRMEGLFRLILRLAGAEAEISGTLIEGTYADTPREPGVVGKINPDDPEPSRSPSSSTGPPGD